MIFSGLSLHLNSKRGWLTTHITPRLVVVSQFVIQYNLKTNLRLSIGMCERDMRQNLCNKCHLPLPFLGKKILVEKLQTISYLLSYIKMPGAQ